MQYLVTGGAGFIGSHLVEELLMEKNSKVVVIDDFSEGKKSNLPEDKRLKVVKASILDAKIDKYFKGAEVVFHLAALSRPRWSMEHPAAVNKVNVEGTLRVIRSSLDANVKKFVFTSSASTYGNQTRLLLAENMQLNPMSPYALTKKIGEEYCKLFGELYGLKYDIVRPFNVYGPRQSLFGAYSAAVPNFVTKLSLDETPYITGDGEQVRDFIFVKDVVRLMKILGKRKESGGVFNAGSGKCFSVNKIYKTISKIMNKDIVPDYVDPVTEPETKASIEKSKKVLGWMPKYSLEEGIKETVKSFTSLY